uniref:Uncharacterized protein n=1 Tax=Eptatretus burgeri TaxID=7764 RepID=A0A8C4QHY8_EPTBU
MRAGGVAASQEAPQVMGEQPRSPFRYYGATGRTPTHWEQRAATALLEYQQASAYLASYNRAHFKAFLSQVNPELIPRILKANCRDAAVQVNPWRETAVQCSLGSRTLTARPVIQHGLAVLVHNWLCNTPDVFVTTCQSRYGCLCRTLFPYMEANWPIKPLQ